MLSFQVRLVLHQEVAILRLMKVLHTLTQLFAVSKEYRTQYHRGTDGKESLLKSFPP